MIEIIHLFLIIGLLLLICGSRYDYRGGGFRSTTSGMGFSKGVLAAEKFLRKEEKGK